jgi:hypothetical protein
MVSNGANQLALLEISAIAETRAAASADLRCPLPRNQEALKAASSSEGAAISRKLERGKIEGEPSRRVAR